MFTLYFVKLKTRNCVASLYLYFCVSFENYKPELTIMLKYICFMSTKRLKFFLYFFLNLISTTVTIGTGSLCWLRRLKRVDPVVCLLYINVGYRWTVPTIVVKSQCQFKNCWFSKLDCTTSGLFSWNIWRFFFEYF